MRPISIAVIAVLTLLTLGRAADTHARGAADQVVGEFVGTVMGQDHLFVAVVADPPAAGASERQVRGYLCDGEQVAEWFVGPTSSRSTVTDQGVVGRQRRDGLGLARFFL